MNEEKYFCPYCGSNTNTKDNYSNAQSSLEITCARFDAYAEYYYCEDCEDTFAVNFKPKTDYYS